MSRLLGSLLLCLTAAAAAATGINLNPQRSLQIRNAMWSDQNADFKVTQVPEQWLGEPGVIIAKELTYAYRKEVLSPRLVFNRAFHLRVRIQNSKALEKYSQYRIRGGMQSGYINTAVYAGFKVIKPNGMVYEFAMSEAVLESESINGRQSDSYKIALSNLEVGDIVDYYLAFDQFINLGSGKYFAFDPVVLTLTGDLPTLKVKVSFDVLRRCYLNLKVLNGAPAFVRSDEEDDNHYAMEMSNLEGVPETEMIFPYRQLPAVKFKVTYASSMMAGVVPVFLGEPGTIKSSVSPAEIPEFMKAAMQYGGGSTLKSLMKTRIKDPNDFDAIARDAYYAYRNEYVVQPEELRLINGIEESSSNSFRAIMALSTYYRTKKIPHHFIIGIPRQVSTLDNLVMEDELTFMLKVNTTRPFYVGRMDANSIVGEINDDLEGETVMIADGLKDPGTWRLRNEVLPPNPPSANKYHSFFTLQWIDLPSGTGKLHARIETSGLSRVPLQQKLMDFYDYQEEESKRYTMPGFTEYKQSSNRAKAEKLKQDYLQSKPEALSKKLGEMLTKDFDFHTEKPEGIKIEQTGRYDTQPEFIYRYSVVANSLTRKVGNNYLLDIGKLIEKHLPAPPEQKLRDFDLFLPSPHELMYTISIPLPKDYSAKGLEQLTIQVDNPIGAFQSGAEIKDNMIQLNVTKRYKTNFVPKQDWPLFEALLSAANLFTGKQVLLERNP